MEQINIASKALQAESLEIMTADNLLGIALLEVIDLRNCFEIVVKEVTYILYVQRRELQMINYLTKE